VLSGADVRHWFRALAVALLATVALSAAAGQDTPVTAGGAPAGAPGADDIRRALSIVKTDPNLVGERTIKALRWNESAPSRGLTLPAWLRAVTTWIRGSIAWLNESTRMLWWLAAAGLAGLLVVYIIRIIRAGGPSSIRGETFLPPTHVQDLDIRPETLPSDIGAAARAMWDRGESRAALALLYRGMLSRLAHVHRVPIRDSSTEGDCLALSADRLPTPNYDYASRLVKVWQRAVYGGEPVQTAAVHGWCVEFGPALDRTVAPGQVSGEPA